MKQSETDTTENLAIVELELDRKAVDKWVKGFTRIQMDMFKADQKFATGQPQKTEVSGRVPVKRYKWHSGHIHVLPITCPKTLESKKQKGGKQYVFSVELLSSALPQKVKLEAFEPSLNDAKADFLEADRRCDGVWEGKRLAFRFGLSVSLMVAQCYLVMGAEKVKKALGVIWRGLENG